MSGTGWYNAVSDFVDQNVTSGYGEKTAFIDPETSITYQQLATGTNRFANVLTDLGIMRERRIALLMRDTVDFPIAYWGALRAGVIPVCMNTLLTPEQTQYMLNDCRAEALFIAASLVKALLPVLRQSAFLKHIIIVGDNDGRHNYLTLFDLMQDASETFETVRTSADEVAFWLYSSGSTGDPKGVRHVHSSLDYVARNYGQPILGIRHDDVCFAAAKLFFAYGMGAAMAVPMSVGATTVLLPSRPTPQSVLQILKTFQPTLFFGVPTLYAAMLANDECQPSNSSDRLRLCISAGEALPCDVGKSWKQRMGVDIIDGVGSTEMLHVFLTNRPDDICYGTSGREFPGYKLRLVDDAGRNVDDDEIGELLVNGGSAAEGYWNQRQKSRATFAGEWVHTGDKYYRDKNGYYHYCGRTDDMFKVSGRWVSPFEVEEALISHPSVLEAAVVAKSDDEGLIKPKAFVVLNDGQPDKGLFAVLKNHVKSSVGVWKYPRWIEFVPDLPKTATGKIQRYKLRA
jgi:4-hydroxybenzoate-CoA ligase